MFNGAQRVFVQGTDICIYQDLLTEAQHWQDPQPPTFRTSCI